MNNVLQGVSLFTLNVLILGCSSIKAEQSKSSGVVDYESCVAAGFPIVKTYPARCINKEGKVFFQKTVQRIENGKQIENRICVNQCGNGVCQQIVCLLDHI